MTFPPRGIPFTHRTNGSPLFSTLDRRLGSTIRLGGGPYLSRHADQDRLQIPNAQPHEPD